MNRRLYITFYNELGCFLSLAACASLFVLGTAAGAFFAREVREAALINSIFDSVFIRSGAVGSSVFWGVFFDSAVWAIIFLFCAFSPFGVLGVSVGSLLRGFLSSFVSCVFIRLYGADGILFSLLFFFSETVLILPFFLILGSKAFESSAFFLKFCFLRFRHTEDFTSGSFFISFVVFVLAAAVFAALKSYLIYPAALQIFPG